MSLSIILYQMLNYMYWIIPFLLSFATAFGELNENFYVKLFAFELIFVIMLVLSVVKKKENTNCNISICIADILMGGLLIICLHFYIEQFDIIDHSVLLMYFFFYFFTRVYSHENIVGTLINIAPIVILLHLLLSILQYFSVFPNFNSYFEIGSTFGNPDMLSAYLTVLLPFCYVSNKWKHFRIMVIALTVFLFFFLQARTAIVATAMTILLYYIRKLKVSKMYVIIGMLILMGGFVLLIHWHSISVLGRFYIWIVALFMIVSKPFGWGPYAFEKYYPEYQSKFTIEHPEIANALNYDVVHSPYNEFLNVAVTIGIVGLIFYLLFTISVLIVAYKTKSLLLYPLLAFQFVSLSYFPFRIIPLTVIYIICCSIVIGTTNAPFRMRITYSFFFRKLLTFCVLIPVIICFSLGIFSFGYWRKAIEQSSNIETYSQACKSFEKSYPFLKNNGRFLISFAELKHKMDDKTSLLLMEQANHYFSDVAFLHNLAVLYEQDGRIKEARQKYEIAINMSRNNIDILYSYIQFLQRIGDNEKVYQLSFQLRKKLINSPSGFKNELILKRLNKLISSYEL